MKNYLSLIIIALFVSCSSEDDNSEMCCGTPISDIIKSYDEMYSEILAKELTAQQRIETESSYKARIENPCFYHRKSLENAGASCEGVH